MTDGMTRNSILHLDGDTFEDQVLNSETPVLVDFWAAWCGPCRTVAPTLEQIASERDDVRIAKVDIDQHQDLAVKYGVSSIPTFILFENGAVKDRTMGALPKSAFEEFLQRNL